MDNEIKFKQIYVIAQLVNEGWSKAEAERVIHDIDFDWVESEAEDILHYLREGMSIARLCL